MSAASSSAGGRGPERIRGDAFALVSLGISGESDASRSATTFIPSLLDWNRHRRSRIGRTSGTRESLIHLLMMAEVGLPLTMVLLCEINPLVLSTIRASIAAHEATALWDVSTAEGSGREVMPFEQHVHSFLESMPIMAASALGCLHWREVREILGGARSRDAWRLRWKRNSLPAGYLAGIGARVVAAIIAPYGEELYRCVTKGDRTPR